MCCLIFLKYQHMDVPELLDQVIYSVRHLVTFLSPSPTTYFFLYMSTCENPTPLVAILMARKSTVEISIFHNLLTLHSPPGPQIALPMGLSRESLCELFFVTLFTDGWPVEILRKFSLHFHTTLLFDRYCTAPAVSVGKH